MQTNHQGAARVRLGELLVKAGVISERQLKAALLEQRRWGGKLGDILVRMRYLSEDVFVRALSKQLNLPRADLSSTLTIPTAALSRVPASVAEEYEVVPYTLLDDGKTLGVATSDPTNLTVLDAIRSIAQCRVVPFIAGASEVRAAIDRLYVVDAPSPVETTPFRILGNSEDTTAAHTARSAPRGSPSPKTAPVAPDTGSAAPFPKAPDALPGPSTLPPTLAPPPYGYPPAPHLPHLSPAAPMPLDEAPRREAQALRALVDLLVHKGVITLDEYLPLLKR